MIPSADAVPPADPRMPWRGGAARAASRRRTPRALRIGRHGLFADAAIEQAYLQAKLRSVQAGLRRFGLGGGLLFLLGAFIDWSALGESWRFAPLLVVRLLVFGVGAYVALVVGGAGPRRRSTLRDAVLAFELAAGLGAAAVTLAYQPDLAYRVVTVLALTLVLYAYLPVLGSANLWVLPALGVLYLAEIGITLHPTPQFLGFVAVLLALAHVAGWRIATGNARVRRQRWLMQRRLRHEVRVRRGAEQNLRHALESCPVPLLVHRAVDGQVVLLNRAARVLFGTGRQEAPIGELPVASFFRRADELDAVLASLRERGIVRHMDVQLRTVDGAPVDVMLAARCLRYEGQAAVLSSLVEITARKQHERELRRLSATDPLTGLRNRRGFFNKAEALLRREGVGPLALLLMDVDHFKNINDTHGHAVGDLVLQMLAGRVKAVLRRPDVLARVGGEEFAVLAPLADLDDACALAERIRDAVARHAMRIHGLRLEVTLSIGVSLVQPGRMAIDNALSRADAAMYRAKHAGRNRVEHRADPTPTTPHARSPSPTGAHQRAGG